QSLASGHVLCGAGASLATVCSFARGQGLAGLEFAWGIPGQLGGAVYMNAGAYGGEMKQVVERVHFLEADGTPGVMSGEDLAFGYRKSAFMGTKRIITSAELRLESGAEAEITAKMEDFMRRRREKQPLELPSAGSVFKRPEGYFAGTLIEQCGLKGFAVGGACVSEKHAGFIVNKGGATCADVEALIRAIQDTVFQATGVELEPEIRRISLSE
ncbi:UDP-N-acetylmuramate dehydrogenase, partial [Hominenteromicrobium sp.]